MWTQATRHDNTESASGPGTEPGRAPHGSSEFGPLLPRPLVDVEIAYGYTAASVNALAVTAARNCRWVGAMPMVERAEVAHSAIAEHLCTASERPEETELIASGWAAMKAQHHRDQQSHGMGGSDRSKVIVAFGRYWSSISGSAHSHEDHIVDHLGFHQIWAVLNETHRDTFRAIANTATRAEAAHALGISKGAFQSRVTRARLAFFALWHQHETPPKMWGADRPNSRPERAMYLLRLRRRKAQLRATQTT